MIGKHGKITLCCVRVLQVTEKEEKIIIEILALTLKVGYINFPIVLFRIHN